MTTTFTPGPWEAVETNDDIHAFGIISVRQPIGIMMNDVAAVWARGGKRKTAANARLIAAAPELLDALRAEEEWRAREADGAIDPEWDYETMVASKRRAAIAKATIEKKAVDHG